MPSDSTSQSAANGDGNEPSDGVEPKESQEGSDLNESERENWEGLLNGRRTEEAELVLIDPGVGKDGAEVGEEGASKPFRGIAVDGNPYWIKPLNNKQNPRIPAVEQIVGRAGQLIDAPVCRPRTLEILEMHEGFEWVDGRELKPGIAHGSLNVPGADYQKPAWKKVERDENARRFAYFYALYDWAWGNDFQGLFAKNDSDRFYSHDHGHFLFGGSDPWDIDDLLDRIDKPRVLSQGDLKELERDAVQHTVDQLRSVQREDIVGILTHIPESWPPSNYELEMIGYFLEYRAPNVADRLASKFGV